MDAEPKNYEIAYLINPDIPEEDVFGEAGKITAAIQDAHGLVGRIEEPKKRRLTYPINKSRSAYFGWTTFTIVSEYVPEIEKRVRKEKNIIRFILTDEVKHPVIEPRAFRPRETQVQEGVQAFQPQQAAAEDAAKNEELDKQLEQILGK